MNFLHTAPARRPLKGDANAGVSDGWCAGAGGRRSGSQSRLSFIFILHVLLPAQVPARRPKKGDAKVRTGVRRRSGCVTGAGGEASKARNAEVRLRAGWRLRRPAEGAPSASAARRLRRPCPNAERRRRTPVRTRTGLRALCREYPSNCCPQTDADSRLRGAGQIRICQPRVRHGYARFGDNVGACPAERPAGPCRRPPTSDLRPQTSDLRPPCRRPPSSVLNLPPCFPCY